MQVFKQITVRRSDQTNHETQTAKLYPDLTQRPGPTATIVHAIPAQNTSQRQASLFQIIGGTVEAELVEIQSAKPMTQELRNTTQSEQQELEKQGTQVQLLRLQLEEACKKKWKSKTKTPPQSQTALSSSPSSQNTNWQCRFRGPGFPQPHLSGQGQVWGGFGGRSRGRGGTPNDGRCFNCGEAGHWSRECPHTQMGYWPQGSQHSDPRSHTQYPHHIRTHQFIASSAHPVNLMERNILSQTEVQYCDAGIQYM